MKHIPNILSFSRIPLSLSLIFVATLNKPILFVCLYAVTALTDAFDGFLARKYSWQSTLGSKLDGFADITLVVSMVVVVFFIVKPTFTKLIPIAVFIGIIAVTRLANLLFTRIKFKQWGTMHSFMMRYGSLPVFILAPVFVLTTRPLDIPVLIILAIALLSNVDETAILALSHEYDMNTKSFWHAKKQRQARNAEKAA